MNKKFLNPSSSLEEVKRAIELKSHVYFIRHNWDMKDAEPIISRLFDLRRVAIHYDNALPGKEFDRNQYQKSARPVVDCINEANKNGGIVVSSYRLKNIIIIGEVDSGSAGVDNTQLCGGEPFQLKFLKLKNEVLVNPNEFPLLFVLQPPFSTMVRWHQGEIAIRHFYEAKISGEFNPREVVLEYISPWQWELIAEEWLRLQNILKYKLVQTGKSMKDFDVLGVDTKENYVVAQVKRFGSQKLFDSFYESTKEFSSKDNLFYFSDADSCSKLRKDPARFIKIVSLEELFEFFIKKDKTFIENIIFGPKKRDRTVE